MPPLPNPVIPPDFTSPFDNELGLVFTDLSPDGARAQLEITPKLLQPMGIVHGGVYAAISAARCLALGSYWSGPR